VNNRIIIILSLSILFSLCACEKEEIEFMPLDDYPVTQGSNPTRIISEKIFEYFTGLNDNEGNYYKICHSGTSAAYYDFLEGDPEIEMIITQQADPQTEEAMKEYFFKPIAKDALVFITNIDNPVDELTLIQIKNILNGKINNWQEVGGNDEPINLFVRNESGGSQILLDKYVIQKNKMKKVKEKNIANDMQDMSKYVAKNYHNGSTLGYTTYYFAEFSGKRNDVKTIKIDDVKADYDSINNDIYPFISYIFIGIKDMDLPAGKIYEWI